MALFHKPLSSGLVLLLAGALAPALVATAPASAAPSASKECVEVLPEPARLSAVVQDRGAAATVAESKREEALTRAEERLEALPGTLKAQSKDPALWLDSCGAPFYKEPLATEGADSAPSPATAASFPLASTFELSSKPGASKTLYLDFTGGVVSGTAWNADYGDPITVRPFSRDGDTAFSASELQQMQEAYLTVAEDYAPFDVNVTTQEPADSALYRDYYGDPVYGVRTYITPGSPIYADCSCGGVAYVGVTDSLSTSTLRTYGPAWVFAEALPTGADLGEAVSHEVGHNLGLGHDGHTDKPYYAGSTPWAPIMGVGYYQPLSQWSKGEYAGATNLQDDAAIIEQSFPYREDDYSGGMAPHEITGGAALTGFISRPEDADSFSFMASGLSQLVVAPAAFQSNLDVAVTLRDSTGAVVTRVAPLTTRETAVTAAGAGATVTFTAPEAGARYTAVVEAAGQGDPSTTGYSTYGSRGSYSLTFSTATVTPEPPVTEDPVEEDPTPEPPVTEDPVTEDPVVEDPVAKPLSFTTAKRLPTARFKRAYKTPLKIAGGTPGYSWSKRGKLPRGLTLKLPAAGSTATRAVLTGKPRVRGKFYFTVTVKDSRGVVTKRAFRLTVRR